jgi:hypothetical protein
MATFWRENGLGGEEQHSESGCDSRLRDRLCIVLALNAPATGVVYPAATTEAELPRIPRNGYSGPPGNRDC